MKITEETLIAVEKALNIKLFNAQKKYLLSDAYCFSLGRRTGKTLAHCIKLALSDGPPINLRLMERYSDYGNGTVSYARGFYRQQFMHIWEQLAERTVIMKGEKRNARTIKVFTCRLYLLWLRLAGMLRCR